MGIIGGILVLPSFSSHFGLENLSDEALANARTRIVILWLVGAALGALAPVMLRNVSRKKGLGCAGGFYVIGAVVMVCAGVGEGTLMGGRGWFELGRFVNGIGVGVGTLVGPML